MLSSVLPVYIAILKRMRCLLLFTLAVCLFANPLQSVAADGTAFDYGDVSRDVSDIGFYRALDEGINLEQSPEFSSERPKNVILMIGDGMGPAEVQLARIRALGADGKLCMERLPVLGLMRTHSDDPTVTDSAAAGTAMACGVKTANGIIGMTPDGTRYMTLLELARKRNMSTGLVATSRITHATPASFACHVKSRGQEEKIATQMLPLGVNVLLGGGRKSFSATGRHDKRDLLAEATGYGYKIVDTREDLLKFDGPLVLGLFSESHMETFPPEPALPEMTAKALDLLSHSKNGFFVMIEGSQIDFAGHANNPENDVRQTLLFDMAVKEAIDFARQNEETLLLVTSDHETGGLTVFGREGEKVLDKAKWNTRGHSAMDVPVYAYGPGAGQFSGALDNTELSKRIARLMGIDNFPQVLTEQP